MIPVAAALNVSSSDSCFFIECLLKERYKCLRIQVIIGKSTFQLFNLRYVDLDNLKSWVSKMFLFSFKIVACYMLHL